MPPQQETGAALRAGDRAAGSEGTAVSSDSAMLKRRGSHARLVTTLLVLALPYVGLAQSTSATMAAATPATTAGAPATAAAAPTQPGPTAEDEAAANNKGLQRNAAHVALFVLVVVGVLTGIGLARRGRSLPIRDIPGLMVFEEAVARATEMGRPTFFTCGGCCEIRRVQLYASMPLLRQVATLSAKLGNRLTVAVGFPETLPVHVNAVRDGYLQADAIDAFRGDDVRYFPGGQFFFAMAAMGWMLEERPATCFYFGWWEADSLMFAETGQTINAMQIAGTDELYQIPFFVAACDYTLIGEEFWAASAKVSQDPLLLGSLGAQDIFKLTLLVLIVGGVLLCFSPRFADWMDVVRKTFG
jgi:hypothetical protein